MKAYGKIFWLGHKENQGILSGGKLIITEKLDGNNARFWKEGGKIIYGTRRTVLGPFDEIDKSPCRKCERVWKQKPDESHPECSHKFHYIAKWIEKNIDIGDLEEGFVYFGEGGIKHTLTYDKLPPFVGFDIWVEPGEFALERRENDMRLSGGRFIPWQSVIKIYGKLGVPVIAEIWSGNASEWASKQKDLESLIGPSYYGDVKMEGIVLKNYESVNVYGRQLFAKVKREEFQEMSKATFGTTPKGMPLALEVAEKYCNAVRIDKAISLLVFEEGKDLGMFLMKNLYKIVGEDILQEEILNINQMAKGRNLNFKDFFNVVAKKCAARLKERLVEQA